jgi:hypothetical protein
MSNKDAVIVCILSVLTGVGLYILGALLLYLVTK